MAFNCPIALRPKKKTRKKWTECFWMALVDNANGS